METRHVVRRGRALQINVPPGVRRHLEIKPGDMLVWQVGRGQYVYLSRKGLRARPGVNLVKEREAWLRLERELDRERKRAAARPMKVFNEGVGQGWGQASKLLEMDPNSVIARLLAEVSELRETLVQVVGASGTALAEAKRAPGAAAQ